MKYKFLSALLLAACSSAASADDFHCPDGAEDYAAEISALRLQQRPLSEQLNESTDTAAAIILANKSIALEERISAIMHRMFECDPIGRLNKR